MVEKSLREQLQNKAKTSYEIFLLWNEKVDKSEWIKVKDAEAVVNAYFASSPEKKELQKLLEEFPKLSCGEGEFKGLTVNFGDMNEIYKAILDCSQWIDKAKPEFEEFLDGYALREAELDKLIQDFPDAPKLPPEEWELVDEKILKFINKSCEIKERLSALKGDKQK